VKYFKLIWAGLWRKPVRTILTLLSVVIAFLLFGMLEGVNQGMSSVYHDLNVDRLVIINRVNEADGLPIAHLNRIKSVPGIRDLTHWTYLGGFFQQARNPVPIYATDVAALFAVYSRLKVPAEQYQAMLHTRTGVLVSSTVAAKYGWKLGDRIPIGSSLWTNKDGSSTYPLDVMGLVDVSAYGEGTGFPAMYVDFSYFDAARAYSNGLVHYYVASIDDPRRSAQIANAIDALFANSAYETNTQSEQEWAQARMKQLGDINLIVNSIVGAVLFTLLFLTGTTMMQSMRERIPELAVLKALGFSNQKILSLVMLESVVLCVLGAALGLLIARVSFNALSALLGDVALPLGVIFVGLGVAAVLSLVSGIPPAVRAARLNIVDAIAGR
jgi:putative ABC transport system permease protein